MKTKLLTTVLMMFCAIKFSAQEVKKYLYKGYLDKYPVTLYLKEEINGCPTTSYSGMYKYDNLPKWIYLEISDDEGSKLVMVEGGITGIISIKMSPDIMKGFWISPDGSKKLNINLKEIPSINKIMKSYDKQFDEINYEMNDC